MERFISWICTAFIPRGRLNRIGEDINNIPLLDLRPGDVIWYDAKERKVVHFREGREVQADMNDSPFPFMVELEENNAEGIKLFLENILCMLLHEREDIKGCRYYAPDNNSLSAELI